LDLYKTADIEWVWRFKVLQAQVLISKSSSREALKFLGDSLPPSLGTKEIAIRKALFEGIAYRTLQDFTKAEQKIGEAEQLATSFQPQMLSQVMNARGALEVDQGKFSSAQITFLRALTLARDLKEPLQEASALGNLARLAISQEHFDEAIDLNQSALKLAQSLDLQSLVTTVLGNMGWAYSELGDFNNGLEFYTRGADQAERIGLSGYSAYWFARLAKTYMALHRYGPAEALSRRTYERAKTLDNAQTMTECLNTLAELSLRTDQLDAAEQYNQQALKLEESGRDHFGVLDSLLVSGRIEIRRQHFAQAQELFDRISRDPKAETPLKWEVRARLAELYDAEKLPSKAEQEYREAIDTIVAARHAINRDDLRLSYLSSGIEFYDEYISFLMRRNRPADALQVAELSRARTLLEGLSFDDKLASKSIPAVQPTQIAKHLDSAILFYWLGEKESYLWVSTGAKSASFTLPKASEIAPLVSAYRGSLRDLQDARDKGSEDSVKLYSILVKPAEALIPTGSKVILLLDPSLSALNFETLIVPDPQPHFWIEDVTLTTASSLTLLASSAGRPASKEKNLLLVGNTVPVEPFPPLPQAPDEMKRVESYFSASMRTVLEGKQATPLAYLNSNPERFSYLHFVTHGTASVTRPLESAVILSKDGESYKLYARDIVKHPLTAQLVTISACEGAGRTAYSGEGLIGLSWAFLRAGAHNVIGALWEVNDSAAPQLMDSFYSELSRGQDAASALRAAKLSLLHSKDTQSVFRKPYYWAPFQLYAGS
jgi:CHAT domain-containing protein